MPSAPTSRARRRLPRAVRHAQRRRARAHKAPIDACRASLVAQHAGARRASSPSLTRRRQQRERAAAANAARAGREDRAPREAAATSRAPRAAVRLNCPARPARSAACARAPPPAPPPRPPSPHAAAARRRSAAGEDARAPAPAPVARAAGTRADTASAARDARHRRRATAATKRAGRGAHAVARALNSPRDDRGVARGGEGARSPSSRSVDQAIGGARRPRAPRRRARISYRPGGSGATAAGGHAVGRRQIRTLGAASADAGPSSGPADFGEQRASIGGQTTAAQPERQQALEAGRRRGEPFPTMRAARRRRRARGRRSAWRRQFGNVSEAVAASAAVSAGAVLAAPP